MSPGLCCRIYSVHIRPEAATYLGLFFMPVDKLLLDGRVI